MYGKLTKCHPELYALKARKINKIPKFYSIFAGKKFIGFFVVGWGASAPCPPPPPRLLHL